MGVPSETRQAHPDGTNGFERILPGPDRMYPDTDHPPVRIDPERINKIARQLPAKPWDREENYRNAGIPPHLVKDLAISPWARLVDGIINDKEGAWQLLFQQRPVADGPGNPVHGPDAG